ncbi:MAG: type II toxin-antitoxin system VapC family toxin [Acidimicrobiia bacterium]
MSDPSRGLLDTSVLIDHPSIDPANLPDESAVSAITFAELAAGPHTTTDAAERSRRQDRVHWATATFEPIPFDGDAARAYGRIVSAVRASGRKERSRVADLLIAATASSQGLALYTRNPDDFSPLDGIVEIRPV